MALSSNRARLVGTNYVQTVGLSVSVPAGKQVCQPATFLVSGAGGARLVVGTYGRPTPRLIVRFVESGGSVVAYGNLGAGWREGVVTVPFERPVGAAGSSSTACVRNGGASTIVLGGEFRTAGNSARVPGGKKQGLIAFAYPRALGESWWPSLPDISRRYAVGKVSLAGAFTLPILAIVLLGMWVAAIRLILREQPR
jgi:hypothetical protein